ncbi:hypothetical protein [Coleofasciculus sp.]|uniref:hypothetical protein n=1 Tax=Coleofasciculus sp. TaxID=3100458 RepID=UPI0039FAB531
MLFQHEVQLIDAQIIALKGRREVLVQRSEQGSKILSELADLLDSLQPVQPEALDTLENEILEMFKVAKEGYDVPGVEIEPEVETSTEAEVAEPEVETPIEAEVTEPEVETPTEAEVTKPEVETTLESSVEKTINLAIFSQDEKLLVCGKSKNRLNRWRDWVSNKAKGQYSKLTTIKKSDLHHITGCKWHFECVLSPEAQRFLIKEYEQDKMPPKDLGLASAA